jgi:3-oxoacyl-[acyl-carrier-protein] synthase-3
VVLHYYKKSTMAFITYKGVGIKAISACVPPKIMYNKDLGYLISEEEIEKTIHSIGIYEKRYAEEDVCSSDLCFKAAQKLIQDNQIDAATIDGVIFVSQTPDYRQPATAPSLQHRLGLNQNCFAFDVNLACSGYIYGLSIAHSFASQQGIHRVLLLVGETMSKTISYKDKVTTPLFGDAGTATLIEKGDYPMSYFSLNSDGSDMNILKIPSGGYRKPTNSESFIERMNDMGNILNEEQLHMIGMDVFNFGIRVVPSDIKNLLNFSGKTIEDVGVLVFHQANKFMTDFFAKRLKCPAEKIPYSLDRFGNTSSASIPLTIVSEMSKSECYPNRDFVIMTGFGAGLSWATSLVSLSQANISELIEY